MILSLERLSGRNDVTSDKVNFRPDINIRLAFEKQNQKKTPGDQEFAWLLKQFGAPVP